jgi:hypothetical protein
VQKPAIGYDRALKADDLAAVTETLSHIIEQVDDGKLKAPPLMLARLAGARDALAVVTDSKPQPVKQEA